MTLGRKAFFLFLLLVASGRAYYAASQFRDVSIIQAENVTPVQSASPIDPNILLPDLVPLPPQDVKLDKRDDSYYLLFSTTYYNQGLGQFELRADPKTAGVRADIAQI